jgi:hypothetical protein
MDSYQFAGLTFPRKVPFLRRNMFKAFQAGTLPGPVQRQWAHYEEQRQAGAYMGENAKPAPRKAFTLSTAYYTAPRPEGAGKGGSGYLESDFALGLRWQWADKVEGVRLEHTGWYTSDDYTGETIRGVVWRLPHARGFLAGWSMGEGMATTWEPDIYPDESGAARAADSIAERVAENERERERDYQAGAEAARLRVDIREAARKRFILRGLLLDSDPGSPAESVLRDRIDNLTSDTEESLTRYAELRSQGAGNEQFEEGFANG